MAFDIALFGAGRIGAVHARNIAEHGESNLKFIVDPASASADTLAARFGATVASEDEIWADPEVDAILVGTATASHAELIEKGLRAGKAVFCEKPIDLSMKRVDEVMSVVKASARPLFLAFNRRFDPGILEMKRRIGDGEIGALELVTVISKDPAGGLPIEYLKTSGGMFRDMTIHDFDMARYIMGEEFVSAQATASSLTDPAIKEIGDIDTATVSMQTASGRIAVIINSRRASYGYDQRVEAHGALGMLRTENVPQHLLVQEGAEGVRRAKSQFFFVERYAQSYANEWAHFVRVLKGEEAPSASGDDGRKALALAEAAYRSLETRQRVSVAM
ncbi:inositol 2-dehydrogenase [Labrys miyagiensis]|uniref:Inositol 2-dehydrogenase n=1 Tax=Labrys miyagiensis TaxID=346912 RepID=A0ABQ6CSQ5_9HYPH|nr:inositol 2-dehydrogenase [Labrys miyagiensis]GLS21231.1 inositol 2-dehydrogenase [Labrys miyagiensis]